MKDPMKDLLRMMGPAVLCMVAVFAVTGRAEAGFFHVSLAEEDSNLIPRVYALDEGGTAARAEGPLPNGPANGFFGFGNQSGFAVPGQVQAFSSLELQTTQQTGFGQGDSMGGAVRATMTIEDLILTGPASSVSARLLFDVHGVIEAVLEGTGDGFGSASAFREIRATGSIRGPVPGGVATTTETLILDKSTNGTFATPFREFLTDEPLDATLDLWIRIARVGVGRGGFKDPNERAALLVDFADTVSFPTSGPVIDFGGAAGFTADSLEANVVDNRWLGAAASPVPEPSTCTLLGLGAILSGRYAIPATKAEHREDKTMPQPIRLACASLLANRGALTGLDAIRRRR